MKEHLEGRFYEIDCVFPVREGGRKRRRLREAIERIRAEAEDAVLQGYNHLILTDERISGDLAADADDPGDGRRALAISCAAACAPTPRSTCARRNASTRIISPC